jgi:hypothetical protein
MCTNSQYYSHYSNLANSRRRSALNAYVKSIKHRLANDRLGYNTIRRLAAGGHLPQLGSSHRMTQESPRYDAATHGPRKLMEPLKIAIDTSSADGKIRDSTQHGEPLQESQQGPGSNETETFDPSSRPSLLN